MDNYTHVLNFYNFFFVSLVVSLHRPPRRPPRHRQLFAWCSKRQPLRESLVFDTAIACISSWYGNFYAVPYLPVVHKATTKNFCQCLYLIWQIYAISPLVSISFKLSCLCFGIFACRSVVDSCFACPQPLWTKNLKESRLGRKGDLSSES